MLLAFVSSSLGGCGLFGDDDDGWLSQFTAPTVVRHAYVANSGDRSVSVYAVNNDSGAWIWLEKAITGGSPHSIEIASSGRFAYTANFSGSSVSQFAIGADGGLAPMAPATVVTGFEPVFVVTTGTLE